MSDSLTSIAYQNKKYFEEESRDESFHLSIDERKRSTESLDGMMNSKKRNTFVKKTILEKKNSVLIPHHKKDGIFYFFFFFN